MDNIRDYGYITENPFPVHRVVDFDKKEVYDRIIVFGNDFSRTLSIDNYISRLYIQIELLADERDFEVDYLKQAIDVYWKVLNDNSLEDSPSPFTFIDDDGEEFDFENDSVVVYNDSMDCKFTFNNKLLYTNAFARDFFEEGNY